jgi:hypothetical protein
MQGSVHREFHLSLDPEIRLRDAGEIMLDVKDILVQLEPHEAEHVDDVPRRLI